ncbi:DedA family protein [Ligilactobacillus salivarius]|uniref:DedA family protein n=1 Tax=Ligilactobacillus salivarius TaxID=1624 RepID=A0ABD7YXD3_9LACO|nr:DedA family protein [Ligilactobacillus salivarius]WHS05459.1 DedA family protein [Ligilactobacillus salivarius]WHS08465.1 DedA family protein [Ligilactobacillus salivarius]WHS09371.1 DedA family protein [Ligilactobacillus salivarius]WHS13311.1 DedA family protein [Ligilactobacillus salivarius]WHS18067.1 DedA family protein [Ligilactobacillus salivarius]
MNTTVLTELINQYGYLAIALLIALENVFPPIPSEVILTFAGFLTLNSELHIIGVIIASTIGAVLGALILYLAGHLLSTERLEKILSGKIGRLLHFNDKDVAKSVTFFKKHGGKAVFFGRLVPVIRSLISIPAGMTHFDWKRFVVLSSLGTLIWNTILISSGHYLGSSWEKILTIFDSFTTIVVVLLGLIIVGYYFVKMKKAK